MPRDSNGNYTLPSSVNPVVAGTTITANWGNTTLNDVAQSVTDSLDRFGRGGMQAALRVLDGAVSAPGLTFNNESTLGMYRPATGTIAFTSGGADRLTINAAGAMTVPGAVSFGSTLTVTGNTGIGMVAGAGPRLQVQLTPPVATPAWNAGDAVSVSGANNAVMQMHAGASGGTLAYAFAVGAARSVGALAYDTSANNMLFTANSAERMRIDSDGRVGIGRAPVLNLDVQSSGPCVARLRGGTGTNQGSALYGTVGSDATTWAIGARGNIYGGIPGNDSAIFTLGSLSLGSNGVADRLLIDASGNVGIGTASPGQRLDVDGAIRTRAASFAEYYFGAANNGAISYDITANSMRFFVNSSERMRIDSSGNVGIGRGASGGLRLDVAGGGRVAELILENAGSAGTLGTSPGLYSPASGQLAISTNAAERMRIDASGNVGIGTPSPTALLHLRAASPVLRMATTGAVASGAAAYLQLDDSAGDSGYIGFGGINNTIDVWNRRPGDVRVATSNLERMRIGANGNVGVNGVADASVRVHVNPAGGNGAGLHVGSLATGITLWHSSLDDPAIIYGSTSVLRFGTQTSLGAGGFVERMRLSASGNVGIGTDAPGARLDVAGNIRVFPSSSSLEMTAAGDLTINASNAAGQFAVRVAGSERMRIDAAGVATYSATGGTAELGFRPIPRSTTSGTAVLADRGRCIAATAGITIPNATFSAGDSFSIYNDSAANITITQGVSLTLRLAGTTTTGNRTLAPRGICTVWFNSASEAIISGGGLS